MNKIRLIIRKEWTELRQQPILVLTSLILPMFFAVLPVLLIWGIRAAGPGASKGLNGVEGLTQINPALRGLDGVETAQAIIGIQVGVLLLLVAAIIPSVIASYSVVGEKTSRTLEPLLATPVTTLQLLLAKCLTALIPSVALTWMAAVVFTVGISLAAVSGRVVAAIITPSWLLLLLLWTPLLSLLTIGLTVAISSRANDPRTVQQFSAIVIVPVMLLIGGQATGLLVLGPLVVLLGAALLGLLAIGSIYLAVALFQRETILTKWS
jgi:ABC-2 type transport system permease protein